MAYTSNMENNFGRGNYRNYAPNYQRPYQAPQPKKHSGAKMVSKANKKGEMITYLTAWNYSRSRGLITVFIAPYKGSKIVKSKTGQEYNLRMCEVTYKKTGQKQHFPVLCNRQTGKTVLSEMGMVINPKAPRGGYFGTFTSK